MERITDAPVTASWFEPVRVFQNNGDFMAEAFLFTVVLALFGLVVWLGFDSDDDNGGGGLMQPALVPVRVRSNP